MVTGTQLQAFRRSLSPPSSESTQSNSLSSYLQQTLKKQVASSFEMYVNIYQTTRRHMSQDLALQDSYFSFSGTWKDRPRKWVSVTTVWGFLRLQDANGEYIWISGRGQASRGDPPVCKLGEALTTLHRKNCTMFRNISQSFRLLSFGTTQAVDKRHDICICMDWSDLAEDRGRWRALVNAVMNLRVP